MEQQRIVQQLFEQAVVALAEGKAKPAVIGDLVAQGVPKEVAESLVQKAEVYKKSEFRKSGMTSLMIGVGLIVLGAVITGATYSAADPGGTFVVTIGLFLAGGIAVLRGLGRALVG